MDEELQEMFEMVPEEDNCLICKYKAECNGGVHGGPSGPMYPPCADKGPETWVDPEKLTDYIRDYMEE